MPQRSISEFRPTGIAIGKRFYSDDDVDAIVLAAGGLPDGEVAHAINADRKTLSEIPLARRRCVGASCWASVGWILTSNETNYQ